MSKASTLPDPAGNDATRRRWRIRDVLFMRIGRHRLLPIPLIGGRRPPSAQELLAQAALSQPIAECIGQIVWRTRLWRSEKADVAAELIAHFQDGLESGASAEDLLRQFGDPRQAAQLIRRAKKRRRPLPWRAARQASRACAALVVLMVLVYGVLAARFFASRPSPPIDYRPRMNAAALAVAEPDRAWPLYREALLLLPASPLTHETLLKLNRTPRPGETGWEILEQHLVEAAAALPLAREAALKPGLGLVVGYGIDEQDQHLWPASKQPPDEVLEKGMFNLLLPHLGDFRRLAQTLMFDAQQAAARGDNQTAAADLRAMLGLARHARETPVIISDLVSISILALMLNTTADLVAHRAEVFSDGDLRDLAHQIAAVDDRAIAIRHEGERIFFHDVVQRLYSDDGSGDGRLVSGGLAAMQQMMTFGGSVVGPNHADGWMALAGPGMSALAMDRRELLEEHDRLMTMFEAEASLPLWQRPPSRAEAELEGFGANWLERVRHFPLFEMLPAISKASINAELAMQRRDAIIVAIALELQRRRHGAWPQTLEELMPSILPAVPPDRFDGRVLKYRLVEGRPLVYSVGVDRDDDGGAPTADVHWASIWAPAQEVQQRSKDWHEMSNGDWVLWPPIIEPLVEDEPGEASHLAAPK